MKYGKNDMRFFLKAEGAVHRTGGRHAPGLQAGRAATAAAAAVATAAAAGRLGIRPRDAAPPMPARETAAAGKAGRCRIAPGRPRAAPSAARQPPLTPRQCPPGICMECAGRWGGVPRTAWPKGRRGSLQPCSGRGQGARDRARRPRRGRQFNAQKPRGGMEAARRPGRGRAARRPCEARRA